MRMALKRIVKEIAAIAVIAAIARHRKAATHRGAKRPKQRKQTIALNLDVEIISRQCV
jgi:hypothetical protein